jgi:hypothetical protein
MNKIYIDEWVQKSVQNVSRQHGFSPSDGWNGFDPAGLFLLAGLAIIKNLPLRTF